MADSVKLKQKFAIKIETTEGVEPVFADADFVEANVDGTSLEMSRPKLDRKVYRGSKLPADFKFGQKEASGALSVEFAASQTPGLAPKYTDALRVAGFRKDAISALTIGAGATSTVIPLADTGALDVGHMVQINGEVRAIASLIADTSITLDFALSSAPAEDDVVEACTQFKLDESIDLSMSFMREQGGDLVREILLGGRVSSVAMENGTVGNVPNLVFSINGIDYDKKVLGAPSGSNPSFDNEIGAELLSAKLYQNAEEFCASEFAWNIDNTLAIKSCMTKANGKIGSRTTEIMGAGSINPYKPNDEIKWDMDLPTYSLMLVHANGKVAVRFPKVRTVTVAEGDADGLALDNVGFEIVCEDENDVPVITYF